MLSVSNYFLKQQDSFNISVFIFYIFKWFYAFNKKEMSYEECVRRSKSNRWPLTLFYLLLNVNGISSQIIFQANTDSQHIRRDYLKLLSLDLVRWHMQYRSTIEKFPLQLKERIRKFTGVPEEIQEPPQKKRKRCEVWTEKHSCHVLSAKKSL